MQLIHFFFPLHESLGIKDGAIFGERDGRRNVFELKVHQVRADQSQVYDSYTSRHAVIDRIRGEWTRKKFNIPKHNTTVLQIYCVASNPERCYHDALAFARRFQKAYHVATKKPTTLLNEKNTSKLIPYVLTDMDYNFIDIIALITHEGYGFEDEDEDYIPEETKIHIVQIMKNQYSDIFDGFSHVRMQALAAFEKGDYLTSSILIGTSSELLINEVLLLAYFEEKIAIEDAKKAFFTQENYPISISTRVKEFLPEILAMTIDLADLDTPMGAWKTHVADLRNRTAHQGKTPTTHEITTAIDVSMALEKYIGDRLAANFSRFPITTTLFVGTDSIPKRSNTRIEDVASHDMRDMERFHQEYKSWKAKLAQYKPKSKVKK